MQTEEDEFHNLSINERISVLLFNNESLLLRREDYFEEVDFSTLTDREFNRLVDEILGYRNFANIEHSRSSSKAIASSIGSAKWSKKSSSDGFSSSYRDIKTILQASGMKDGDTFVDIGSSYGRVGCVVGTNFPSTQFTGYEIVRERCIEAQRITKFLQMDDNVQYFPEDVTADNFVVPDADWYFIYDSFDDQALDHIVKKIYQTGTNRTARLIAKYTGSHRKYSDSPYLELISSMKRTSDFGGCWFYRLKQISQGDIV